jgi:hypothetical protein
LGAVIYSCLAGHPPHAGGSVHEMLAKLVREPVPALEVVGVGRRGCAILDRALARDPQLRYRSIGAFRQALSALANGDEGAPEETATFDAAEIARGADQPSPDAARDQAATDVARRPHGAAVDSRRQALRKRAPAIALACVASGLLLPLAFEPISAKLQADPPRNVAPQARLFSKHRPEESTPMSGLVEKTAIEGAVSTAHTATLSSLRDASDAVGGDPALARPIATAPGRAIRPRRARVSSRVRDESERGADVQPSPVTAPDPMDRRR